MAGGPGRRAVPPAGPARQGIPPARAQTMTMR
jgi:hypothetical protein